MDASQIRRKFLDFFVSKGHTEVPSSPLVPADDPTLLFTNAGMVQFKRTFLGQDPRAYVRATTCQKCVRAGGKHNDLEQVGQTKRHLTFFEMLGNFSFGDYFKREAIAYAWEFVTSPTGLNIAKDRLRVTVHHSDNEARQLWREVSGLPDDRIYGLSDKDNFWQMGDTGPCGPCTEIFVDQEWTPSTVYGEMPKAQFEELTESGRFVEIWNLVFMQFDRSADGTLTPLPKPSVDTGAGLDRIASVLQGKDDVFHTDGFLSLIADVERLVGAKYPGGPEGTGISYRVLADHARSVSFLLLDGVYPSNEGRGFVLRRILRRAVRHAWLLGRREPTLVHLVPTVVALMGEAYPGLESERGRIMEVVQREEENFYSTIDAGLARLEQVRESGAKRINGDEAFKLFDTYGFPIDLTELIAGEWGITVDIDGFDRAMTEQRERSRAVRKGTSATGSNAHSTAGGVIAPGQSQKFTGYDTLRTETTLLGGAVTAGHGEILLAENPFYAGGGGQLFDLGTVSGDGWTMQVEEIVKDDEKRAVLRGPIEGSWQAAGRVVADVNGPRRRDIERNHSATHLVHLALRRALGDHVRQQGSLVEPGRLRFDFSHHAPIAPAQLEEIEGAVNELVLANAVTDIRELPLAKALELGAMAFFADKYGDVVRVVQIGDSIELCGGTHVRSAGQVGLFRFVTQGGVAAGVRRIEATTGHGAYAMVRQLEQRIAGLAGSLRAQPDQLERKLEALVLERDKLLARLDEATKGGGAIAARELQAGPVTLVVQSTVVEDRAQLGTLADEFRQHRKANAILVLVNPTTPTAISFAVTDDLIKNGKDANALMKLFAAKFSGRGGGRPTFASGSIGAGNAEEVAIAELPSMVQEWVGA